MLLAIDAGNTNVVFAVHDGSGWRGRWRIATSPGRTSGEYAVWLLALLSHARLKPADISRRALGTLVPAALYTLRRLVRDWFGCEPLIARASSVEWGCEILVDRPMEVGADRLPNALAAHDQYAVQLIVADFGTATTFGVVGEGGAHIGRHLPRHQPVDRGLAAGPPPASPGSASAGPRRSLAGTRRLPCNPRSSGTISGWWRDS
jgi:type III pantothenate kinase